MYELNEYRFINEAFKKSFDKSDDVGCWVETVKLCKSMKDTVKSEKVMYSCINPIKRYKISNIKFFNMKMIDCAMKYKGLNPLVLNESDDIFAGGWVNNGFGKSVFRSTNYLQTLLQSFHPILKNEAIYSAEISIKKESKRKDSEIVQLNLIACPALKYPETTRINNESRLLDKDVEILKNRIRLIIQTAVKYDHDTIIFGAMGCGELKNPIKHVAEIFKEVLDECDGVILNYYFAIVDTTNDSIFEIFSKVFNV